MSESDFTIAGSSHSVPDDFDYCELTNDLLFHMVFSQNKTALRSLLSSLLGIPESNIQNIDVLNPIQYNESIDTKITVLDLKLYLNNEQFILVEMQVRRFEYWTDRTMLYACRQIDEQSRGQDFQYSGLHPVIQIAIMNHTLFPDHRKFYAHYTLRDEEGYCYSNRLAFYVLDLTAMETATPKEREQGLVEWARAFNARDWHEFNQIDNSGVREVARTMETIMSKPSERQLLWDRKLAQMDYDSQIASAKKEGEARLGRLMRRLMEANRTSDAFKAAADQAYRDQLYRELGIN